MAQVPLDRPHRRFNALTGEWILVSPHRAERPWLGEKESLPTEKRPRYDEGCYLCPGNIRANGERNPQYESTHVFTNDFAALIPRQETSRREKDPLFGTENAHGTCRVVCFSPRHDLTLAEMPEEGIRKVVDAWAEQLAELGRTYRWVQIFENKGAIMGCSNPHPHGQIWAGSFLPQEPEKEHRAQGKYFRGRGSVLLVDYLGAELKHRDRVVLENDNWAVLLPFWAVWPFETILIPKSHVTRLTELSPEEKDSLADIIKKHLSGYDSLFDVSFPYTMGWHGAPTDGKEHPYWQLHAHYYPPFLRSATVKKFMVGYEMLSEPQRDITAEQAAQRLREARQTDR